MLKCHCVLIGVTPVCLAVGNAYCHPDETATYAKLTASSMSASPAGMLVEN